MEFISDLHLHSRYSRAVSPQMILPEMATWAVKKGINLLTAGDFTHPIWFKTIKSELEETNDGIYKLKSQTENNVRFLLTTEISSIYKQEGRVRRIHNLIFAPNIKIVEKINKTLLNRGCNLSSDGRPIVGLSAKEILELLLNIDKGIILIPCHVWTPHFGIFGSASGFDSIKECFGDLSNYVYGIETGISSDPWMNWQVNELKDRSILSFSDAHSLPKIGREATVFEINKTLDTLSYTDIGKAISYPMRKKSGRATEGESGVSFTIEFYPEEGKYHYTGHRSCKVIKSPAQIKKSGNICPICSKKLTEGVMFRVQNLAGNVDFRPYSTYTDSKGILWISDSFKNHPPFVKLVPLDEIIAESLNSTVVSKKVKAEYDRLCLKFGSEINVLIKTSLQDLSKTAGEKIAEGIRKVREGNIVISPGYDGEYGKVKIWNEGNLNLQLQNKSQEVQIGISF